MKNHISTSRKKTVWDGTGDMTKSQSFIQSKIEEHYEQRHPVLIESGEADFINSKTPAACPFCGNVKFIKFGKTSNNIYRYKCSACSKTFLPTTGTIFDEHRISISEWIEYCFNIFRHVSISADSWNNKNAFETSRYWLQKLFLTLESIQRDIVLSGTIILDETFFPVRGGDMERKEDGTKPRGHSCNQYCIGVATDGENTLYLLEGMGHPSAQMTYDTFYSHITPGSTLIHDRERSHIVLIDSLSLKSESYSADELKKMSKVDNPMQPVNDAHALLKHFLRAHSGFIRENLQGFLNLFAFVSNPPYPLEEKIDIILNLAFESPHMLRYRDFYPKKETK